MLTLAALFIAFASDPMPTDIRVRARPILAVAPTRETADLASFGKAIVDAKIVGLGEGNHGSREIYLLKHRVFRYLVEKHGFSVLAMESNYGQTLAADDFVLRGIGSAEEAAKSQGFWTYATEEVRDLLQWMREYNLDPKHTTKLRIVGIDSQEKSTIWPIVVAELKAGGVEGRIVDDIYWLMKHSHAETLAEAVKEVEAAAVKARSGLQSQDRILRMEHLVDCLKQSLEISKHVLANEDRWEELMENRASLERLGKTIPEALNSEKPLRDETKALLSNLAKGTQPGRKEYPMLKAAATEVGAIGFSDLSLGLQTLAGLMEISGAITASPRERIMADNIDWIRTKLRPGAKVMFWGHDSHVSYFRSDGKPFLAGSHLAERHRDAYRAFSITFDEGSFNATGEGKVKEFTVGPSREDSLNAALRNVGHDQFFLDFNQVDATSKRWLEAERPWRAIGGSYSPLRPDLYYEPLEPGKLFRGLFFLRKVTAARRLD